MALSAAEWQAIQPGDRVTAESGEPAGFVVEVTPEYLAVSRGRYWLTSAFIPRSAVTQDGEGRLRVGLQGEQVHYRWQ
jgi:hypothetical protein